MKLVGFGAPGAEKPGILDSDGQIRDLSAHIDDINGAARSSTYWRHCVHVASLPVVAADTRLGACLAVSANLCVSV